MGGNWIFGVATAVVEPKVYASGKASLFCAGYYLQLVLDRNRRWDRMVGVPPNHGVIPNFVRFQAN